MQKNLLDGIRAKTLLDGWKEGRMEGRKDGWMDEWMEVKAGLRIAYSNQKEKWKRQRK